MQSAVQSPHALLSMNLDTNEDSTVSAWKGAVRAAHGVGAAISGCRALPGAAAALQGCLELLPASAMAGTSLPAREERYQGGKQVPAGKMENKKQLPAVIAAARGSQLW